VAPPTPIYRAPMRARDRDSPPGEGAEICVQHGVVGIGAANDERSARRLHRFAEVHDGAFVWTRTRDGAYRLGRLAGPLGDAGAAAEAAGLPHVRPTTWLEHRFGDDEVPPGVAATFARGGRNFQRIHDEAAERLTAVAWEAHGG
jgi:hypothetical protein